MQFGNAKTKKALLLCAGFFLFFSFFHNWIGKGNDFIFHFEQARGNCAEGYSEWTCEKYPPLFHIISKPFVLSHFTFKLFILFLFAFLTPFLLYLISRRVVAVPLYFASSYFYFIQAGQYAQGLTMILLLSMFAFRSNIRWLVRGLALIFAPYTHSYALPLIAFTFFLLLLQEGAKRLGFLAGCSPFWGKQGAPKPLAKPLTKVYPPQALTLNTILSFLAKICPLPFLIIGLKELWKKKEFIMLAVIMLSAVASLHNNRTLYTIPLLIMPAVASYHSRIGKKKKRWLNLLILLFVAFQFEQFVAFNLIC